VPSVGCDETNIYKNPNHFLCFLVTLYTIRTRFYKNFKKDMMGSDRHISLEYTPEPTDGKFETFRL